MAQITDLSQIRQKFLFLFKNHSVTSENIKPHEIQVVLQYYTDYHFLPLTH